MYRIVVCIATYLCVLRLSKCMPESEYTDSLHPRTQSYIESTTVNTRKDMGQYFTPQTVIHDLLDELPTEVFETPGMDILDPSSGTGEFLLAGQERFNNPNLEGWELDSELVDISREILPDGTSILNTNSLYETPTKEYDVIIGNPPYYEMKLNEDIREEFGEVIYGRTNIYSLFIYKSLQMLKDGGYLAFVNPPSMNNGAYFKELRKYIVNNCSIEHLSVHTDTEIFEDASQSVMYLVLKKGGTHDDYVFSKNGITIFSESVEYLKSEFDGKKTLSELGYKVRTGRLVWNKNKDKLRESPSSNTIPILWSKNIVDGDLQVGEEVHNKPQYIDGYEASVGPAVIVNRIVGQPGQGSIRAAYVDDRMKFVGENHVNVITPVADSEQELTLLEVFKQLNSDKNVKIVQTITGNSQISKTELQELFPFEV